MTKKNEDYFEFNKSKSHLRVKSRVRILNEKWGSLRQQAWMCKIYTGINTRQKMIRIQRIIMKIFRHIQLNL